MLDNAALLRLTYLNGLEDGLALTQRQILSDYERLATEGGTSEQWIALDAEQRRLNIVKEATVMEKNTILSPN